MAADHRLLILSCSQRKRSDPLLLPAIERYDGPAFHVLRKFLRKRPTKERHPDVYILSAQFGLISADHLIPDYDHRMTPQRARTLQSQVLDKLGYMLKNKQYKELLINVGKEYTAALSGYEHLDLSHVKLIVATDSRGRRQAQLYDWLHGEPPPIWSPRQRGFPRIRGITITLTPEQVFDVARTALLTTSGVRNRYPSWYVVIDGQCMAAKALVSHMTGLPVSAFGSDEARRLLGQLGIKVIRA